MKQNFKIAVPDGCTASIEQQNGFLVVTFSPKQEEEKWEPKDGDFYTTSVGGIAICNRNYKAARDIVPCYCCLSTEGNFYIRKPEDEDCGFGTFDEIRPATDEEKQRLIDALVKKGKRWNVETKQIEDLPRWRALHDENYYCIGSKLIIDCQTEIGHVVDDNRYNAGNYFKTREAAEKVAEQIREIFKNSKAE